MSTPVKKFVDESTHTSGGIRKSLLTPIRRIGLSRTRKTPMSIEKLLTSPIISTTPVSDSLNTTPVSRRSLKSWDTGAVKDEGFPDEDKIVEENKCGFVEKKNDEVVKCDKVNQTVETENHNNLVDKIKSISCEVSLEKNDINLGVIEIKKKNTSKGPKKKKGKLEVTKKKLKEITTDNAQDKTVFNNSELNKTTLELNTNKLELANESKYGKFLSDNNFVEEEIVTSLNKENCDLKSSHSKRKDFIDDTLIVHVNESCKNLKEKSSKSKETVKKTEKGKKNKKKIIRVLDTSSDEENYFKDFNVINSSVCDVKIKGNSEVGSSCIDKENDNVGSQIKLKKSNKIVISSSSDENVVDKAENKSKSKLERNLSTNSKSNRKRLSLKSSTSTIVLSDSDDDFLVKPKIPKIISTSSNNSKTNSFSIQKSQPDVNIDNLLLDLKELDERLSRKEKILEELKQAKIYKNKHNVNELRELTTLWKSGCQNALLDLLSKLKGNEIVTNMGLLLKNLNVPESLIRYDAENDCFL